MMENVVDRKKRILTTVVSIILILSVVLCLFVTVKVLTDGYVSIAGYSFFKVVTPSMEPEYPVGTLIITQENEIEEIELGDVVTFRTDTPDMADRIITHRVVDILHRENEVLLQTKGDANLAMDGFYVDSAHMIGRVVWASSDSGFFNDLIAFFTNKIGFIVCIAFPCLLIAAFIMRGSVRRMKKDIAQVVETIDAKEENETPVVETEEEMRARILAELKEELKIENETKHE